MEYFNIVGKTPNGTIGLKKWASQKIDDLKVEITSESPFSLKVTPTGKLKENTAKDDLSGVMGYLTRKLYLKMINTSIKAKHRFKRRDYEVSIK